jgi:hypothetical protein
MMACRSEMLGQDFQYTVASIGPPGEEYQDRIPVQECKTGLPGNEVRNRTARADFAMI